MRISQPIRCLIIVAMGLVLAIPVLAQDVDKDKKPSPSSSSVASGGREKVKGVIVRRDPDSFVLRDQHGSEMTVVLTDTTKVQERKSNPFRSAGKFATTQLLRGLNLEVEGRRNSSGALVAEKIKFTKDDYKVAQTVESNVTPVEHRVGETETRLSQAEQNAKRLSGQLEELGAISNAARSGAKTAQETADTAVAGVRATNERISTLDDYEVKKTVTANFKFNSATLTPSAKQVLDEIANQAKNEKGFVIEVTGFASADGNKAYNRRLSQRRADAVIRYLVEVHNIPLRRIVTPFGYGDLNPVADNSMRSGREQNRRVEIRILVSRGITTPAAEARSTSSP